MGEKMFSNALKIFGIFDRIKTPPNKTKVTMTSKMMAPAALFAWSKTILITPRIIKKPTTTSNGIRMIGGNPNKKLKKLSKIDQFERFIFPSIFLIL